MDPESLQTDFPPIIEEEDGSDRDDLESHLEGNDTQFQNPRDEAYPEHTIAIGGKLPLDQLPIDMGETDSEENENQQEEEEPRDIAPQGNNHQEGTPQRDERGYTNPGVGGE